MQKQVYRSLSLSCQKVWWPSFGASLITKKLFSFAKYLWFLTQTGSSGNLCLAYFVITAIYDRPWNIIFENSSGLPYSFIFLLLLFYSFILTRERLLLDTTHFDMKPVLFMLLLSLQLDLLVDKAHDDYWRKH